MVKIIAGNKMSRGRWAAVLACVALALGAGFLGGWFSYHYFIDTSAPSSPWMRPDDPLLGKRVQDLIMTQNIEDNLKRVSRHPHMAGSEENKALAEYLRDLWIEQGLDSAGIDTYNVLLSYPGNQSNPNKIEIITDIGSTKYEAPLLGEFADKQMPDIHSFTPYVSFSKPGTVEGEAVFIAQATSVEDLLFLKNNQSVDIAGKIVLACPHTQYSVAALAIVVEALGAVGLIVFPNPLETAPLGPSRVFPQNKWLPGSTAKREILSPSHPGDSLTPGYPAKDYAIRLEEDELEPQFHPTIPVQTLGYEAALELMKHFDENTPEVKFFGLGSNDRIMLDRLGLEKAIPYPLKHGGRMKYGRKLRLTVNNRNERRNIYNTCGIIKGEIEPDRLVIVGNHRDAWVYGAVDPGGGTAIMMELVRVFGHLNKQGRRPRRSLIFCSWDAEEFGLIGSMEWVEDKIAVLNHKAVAHINLDIAVMGRTHLTATASPLLNQLIFDTARKISHPHYPTLYDAWNNISLSGWPTPSKPRVEMMYPNSDHASFLMRAGIPSTKVWLRDEGWDYYLAYHTAIDTFEYVKKMIDPTFVYHRIVADFHAHLLASLVDDTVLPMQAKDYAFTLQNMLLNFKAQATWSDDSLKFFIKDQGRGLMKKLEYAIGNFSYAALTFHREMQKLDKTNPYKVREINDKLVMIEKAFIDLNWRPQNPVYKHVLMSPSLIGGNVIIPGINDALNHPAVLEKLLKHEKLSKKEYRLVEKEFVIVLHALDRAIDGFVV